jgi:hypothetical protein
MSIGTLKNNWRSRAYKELKGKTIHTVRYLTDDETRDLEWTNSPLAIFFTDGSFIFPSSDDEGNAPGALFTSFDELPIIPVI